MFRIQILMSVFWDCVATTACVSTPWETSVASAVQDMYWTIQTIVSFQVNVTFLIGSRPLLAIFSLFYTLLSLDSCNCCVQCFELLPVVSHSHAHYIVLFESLVHD